MIVALAIPFALLFGGMFLLMYHHTASAHSGSSVQKKNAQGFWGTFWNELTVTNPLAAGIHQAVGFVLGHARAWISHWALAAEKPIARWFDGLTELNRRTYAQMSGTATDTANALEMMRHHVVPHEAAKAAAPGNARSKTALAKANAVTAREKALSARFSATHAAQVKLNVHYSHAVDVTLPQRIGGIKTKEEKLATDQAKLRERTTSLENGAVKTWEWLRTHPLSVAAGAFAAAIAIALPRIGLGQLRCTNFKNMLSKWGCRVGTLLDRLLPLAVLLTIAFDFPDFVRGARLVAEGIGGTVASIEGAFDPHLPPLPAPNR